MLEGSSIGPTEKSLGDREWTEGPWTLPCSLCSLDHGEVDAPMHPPPLWCAPSRMTQNQDSGSEAGTSKAVRQIDTFSSWADGAKLLW